MPRTVHARFASALLSLALAAGLLTAALAPRSAQAQFINNAPTTSQGTQFVRPAPKPEAPKTEPITPEPTPPAPTPAPAPQPAAVPAPQEAPPPRYPTVVFLLDASDSMMERSGTDGPTRLDEAREALSAVIREMQPEARVQVQAFNSRMSELRVPGVQAGTFLRVGDTPTRNALIAKLDSVRTAGATNLYRSVLAALKIFGKPADQADYRSGRRFPVLVIVSDGQDSGNTQEDLDDVLAAKTQYPLVTINVIGFRLGAEDSWFKQLCTIATRPGGCAAADNERNLQRLLEAFHRYSE